MQNKFSTFKELNEKKLELNENDYQPLSYKTNEESIKLFELFLCKKDKFKINDNFNFENSEKFLKQKSKCLASIFLDENISKNQELVIFHASEISIIGSEENKENFFNFNPQINGSNNIINKDIYLIGKKKRDLYIEDLGKFSFRMETKNF